MKKIIIIGGVAIGATAAARLRRLNESDEIIIFEKDEYISFANCGLPYYIGETITQREKLIVQEIEAMKKRYNIDIRNFSKILKIDRENKQVIVKNSQTNQEYTESYDKIIIGTGSTPIKPPFPGIETAKNVMTLRNIPDTDQIKAIVDKPNMTDFVIVGGGFIGVELAENLIERGKKVTIVDLANQVLGPFDFEMAQMIHAKLEAKGVKLLLNEKLTRFENNGETIVLESGIKLNSSLTILAIGVVPASKLAKDANLDVTERGAIKVNEYMQTSDPDIYAGGDAVSVKHYLDKNQEVYIPLAWPANRQARLIADNIHDSKNKYQGTLGSSVLKVFNLTAAATGLNEKLLKSWGYEYEKLYIHRNNHASYYPNASIISLKVLFNSKTEEIYGAQAIGQDGVEKRIDVIATAIKGKLKITELMDLELTYAPPFNSAKDPVNIVGYVAENIILQKTKQVHWDELDQELKNGAVLIDVRTAAENQFGAIKNSINLDLDELRNNISKIEKYKTNKVIVHCAVGFRGYLAEQVLKQAGFKNVANLAGGYTTYKTANYQLKKKDLETFKQQEETKNSNKKAENKEITIIDGRQMMCPGPLVLTSQKISEVAEGTYLKIYANDCGFPADLEEWSKNQGHTFVKSYTEGNDYVVELIKGSTGNNLTTDKQLEKAKNVTIVLMSGEYDKAMAALIIANGAIAYGKKVTIFCTFWGLNLVKNGQKFKAENKNWMLKLFSKIMPNHRLKMPISSFNFGSIGQKMMVKIMQEKNVDDIQVLYDKAVQSSVEFIACTMSMDVMGIDVQELEKNVKLGGVGAYIAKSDDANITLFI